MVANASAEGRAPGSKAMPYQVVVPAVAPRKVMGLAEVPDASRAPRMTSSTREASAPVPSPSVAAASTMTPGSIVKVAAGATITSPVSR